MFEHVPLTPTERRITNLLLDGYCHSLEQLRQCLSDNLSDPRIHISNVRKKLRATGYTVQFDGTVMGYRLVRTLESAHEG
jgi:DNA-binding CsgD family transcriptional regulator